MATSIATAGLPVIKAAGGIVLRHTLRGEEVMVVFRKRYQDWTLPKGKLKDGESFEEAALREVEEETGCACRLGSYLGGVSYAVSGVPKVVMFWRMSVLQEKPIADNEEIGEALWMSIPGAIQRLTHAQERSLLSRVAGGSRTMTPAAPAPPLERETRPAEAVEIQMAAAATQAEPVIPSEPAPIQTSPTPMPSAKTAAPVSPALVTAASPIQAASVLQAAAPVTQRNVSAPIPVAADTLDLPSPELPEERMASRPHLSREDRRTYAQLGHELEAFKVELAFLQDRGQPAESPWRKAAMDHVSRVERYLDSYDVEGALAGLRAARRYAVLGLNPAELAARAQVLREEARKFSSWRAVAIQRLLAVPEDKLTPARVADAMALRDEAATDQQLRGRIVNDRLRVLALVCFLGALAALLSLPASGLLHEFAPLIFCGLLGSSLAAAQSLIANKSDGKLPNRLLLPALVVAGAGLALAANFLYQSTLDYFKLEQQYAAAIYVLAIVLGYGGERLLAHFAGYSRERTSAGPY